MVKIERVGIVGAGTMGAGIATNIAQHGVDVQITDINQEVAARAKADAAKFFDRQREKGRMSDGEVNASKQRIEVASDIDAFGGCDLIIEAVFEDFALKAALLDRLNHVRHDSALVATNTSCLKVSDLQQHDRMPARFLGMHYFSPAQINPIVEIVKGEATDDATIDAALAFCRATRKQPIQCKDSFGFAINRFFCPYTNEAVHALDDGLGTPAQIDAVAKAALGVAAGPFQVMNLIKPRINLHAIRNLAPLGQFYAPAASMRDYGEADRSWQLDEDPNATSAQVSAISDKLRAGVFLPVLEALDEAIAEPRAFDLGAQQALKMSRPPCALMDELGKDEVARIVEPALLKCSLAMPASIERVGGLTAQ